MALFSVTKSVTVEVSFDATFGCFVKFGSHELDFGDSFVGGYQFVELVANLLHQIGQLVASDAQLVHRVVVGIDKRYEFALAHDDKALAHVEHVVELGLDLFGVDVLSAGAEQHGLESSSNK